MTEYKQINCPYTYPGTSVLMNKLDIRDQKLLDEVERKLTAYRLDELRENPIQGNFDYDHLKNIHHHIFQDIYEWAGQERKVTIGKGGKIFCSANNLDVVQKHIFFQIKNDNYLKNLNPDEFSQKASLLLKDINYMHPFREGNGRSQREFMRELAQNAGYQLNLSMVPREHMIFASREAMNRNPKEFERMIKNQLKPLPEKSIKKPFDMGF